jgi:transcriptional regulator with XRE-family HTH domain
MTGDAVSADGIVKTVSRNLKRIRTLRGLSLADVARDSRVARATLYQLENGNGNPTIDTLFAISTALAVPMSELITDAEPPAILVVRADEATTVAGGGVAARLMRRLDMGGGVLEVYDIVVTPDVAFERSAHPHGVFEHVLVHSGRLRLGPVGDQIVLEPGDFISFRGDREHQYEALDGVEVRGVLLMSYPSSHAVSAHRPELLDEVVDP